MDELPSKIARTWGTRTLRRSKRYFSDVNTGWSPDEIDSRDKNMDLVDIEEYEDVRHRATSLNYKRILINRYKGKSLALASDRKGFTLFNEVIRTRITERIKKKYNQMKFKDFSFGIDFIDRIFRTIEGKFGFIVLSYFHFLWWLFLVNLVASLFIIFFLIMPQTLMSPIDYLSEDICNNSSLYENKEICLSGNTTIESYFVKLCLDFRTCYYTQQYQEKIQMNYNQSSLWRLVNFLQGTGWMEQTFLFLGSYTDKTHPGPYNMQVAILLVTAIYFIVFLLFIVSHSSSSIQQRMMSHKKFTHLSPDSFPSFLLADKLFSGWDFMLNDPKKALSKKYQLKKFFADMYLEFINFGKKKPSKFEKLKLWMVRLLINIIIFLLILVSLTAIVVSIIKQEVLTDQVKTNSALKLFCSFIPAFTVVFFNTVMPIIFNKLIDFERYSMENKLNLMLIRSLFITMASVITLVISIGGRMLCDQQPCDKDILCWETYIGQQLYKLSLVNFFLQLLTFFIECIRRRLVDGYPNSRFLQWVGVEEFNVPKNIIDLIYKQTICWLGILVAPVLSLIITFKFFIIFFLKFLTLKWNCKPSEEQRTFESNYFFLVILLITFFICAALNAFAVGRILPSSSCGPFRVYDYPYDYMSDRISMAIEDHLNAPLRTFVLFLGSWMIFIVVLIVLSLFLLYYQSIIAGNKMLTRNLKNQLSIMQIDNHKYKKELQALKQKPQNKNN